MMSMMSMMSVILFVAIFGSAISAPAPYICGKNIMITSENKVENYDQEDSSNNDINIKKSIYNINSEIKLSANQEAVCFELEEEKVKLAITLNSVEDSCISKKFMYAVPKDPSISCFSKFNTNWFNNYHNLCSKRSYEEVVKKYFADKQKDKIIAYSCNNEYGGIVDTAYWWMASLNIDTRQYYKVYKCLDHQRIYSIDIFNINTGRKIAENMLIRENQRFVYNILPNIQLIIDDLVISSKPFLNFGNTCYITNEFDDPLGLITKCNDETSLSPGMFGEIKCGITDYESIDLQSCEAGNLLFDIKFDSYGITTCKMNTINYNAIMQQFKLPYTESNNYIYKENGAIFIKRLDSTLLFNIKSNFKVSQVYYKDKCDIISHDLDYKTVIYNRTASFDIKVYNNRPVLISFICKDNHINIPPVTYSNEDTYNNINIKFYPVIKDIDTACKIICGTEEKSMFKIKGKFFNVFETKHAKLLVNGDEYIAYPEDVSDNVFGLIGHAISEFISTIWGKIVSAVTTFIILCIVIIGVCMCLGKIPCCFCKKNKLVLDDNIINNLKNYKKNNVDLEMQEVVNLIDNTEYFAFNGESIKILDEDYSITPTGINYKNKPIVHSIPHVIFYDKRFYYKDDKIFFNNQVVVNKVKTSRNMNTKYILDKGLVYHFDNSSKPVMMLRDHNLSDMRILDVDYTEFDNSLYLNGNLIIKNIFLDI